MIFKNWGFFSLWSIWSVSDQSELEAISLLLYAYLAHQLIDMLIMLDVLDKNMLISITIERALSVSNYEWALFSLIGLLYQCLTHFEELL